MDAIFQTTFSNTFYFMKMYISTFVPKGPIKNSASLVQKTAWRRPGDRPFSEPMWLKLYHLDSISNQYILCMMHHCFTMTHNDVAASDVAVGMWRHNQEATNHERNGEPCPPPPPPVLSPTQFVMRQSDLWIAGITPWCGRSIPATNGG